MTQAVPIFYNNLDRRTDRRAFMEAQLARLGLDAMRQRSFDATTCPTTSCRLRWTGTLR